MKTHSHNPWLRLVTAARHARDARDTQAPYGFSTRVSALAMSLPRPTFATLCDRLSLRALGVAALLFIACAALNFPASPSTAAEDELIVQDPVVEMIEVAS